MKKSTAFILFSMMTLTIFTAAHGQEKTDPKLVLMDLPIIQKIDSILKSDLDNNKKTELIAVQFSEQASALGPNSFCTKAGVIYQTASTSASKTEKQCRTRMKSAEMLGQSGDIKPEDYNGDVARLQVLMSQAAQFIIMFNLP